MNSSQIECFLTVAECLNFSRAAESLFMTQTAVTYQVASLEKELGVRLFDRSKRQVVLTPAGQVFLQWAKRIDLSMREAMQRTRSAQQASSGYLSIGTYGDVLFPYLPGILAELRRRHPGVTVDLRQRGARGLVNELSSGDIDLAIMTAYGQFVAEQSWIESVPIFSDTHSAVLPAGHRLASRTSIAIEELQDECVLLFSEPEIQERETGPNAFSDVRFLDSPQSVTALIAAGYGVSVAVSHVCDRNDPRLAIVPIEDTHMEICACYRKNNASPEIAAFLEIVSETEF